MLVTDHTNLQHFGSFLNALVRWREPSQKLSEMFASVSPFLSHWPKGFMLILLVDSPWSERHERSRTMEYSDGTATSKYQLSITSSIQRLTGLATSSANNSQVSGGHIVKWTARTCKEFHMQDSLIPYISFIYEISKEHSHPFLSKTHCVPRFLRLP